MKKEDVARELFGKGYACSQAVLGALCEDLGMSRDLAFRIAAPFRAGMGRTGRTCGAVTGAYMALGLGFGDGDPADNAAKDKVCALVQEFDREFTALHGSTGCSELVGCDMGNPEARAEAAQKGLFHTLCPNLVGDAVKIAVRLMGRDQSR